MGSPVAVDGRCGAQLKDETFCKSYPVKGQKRCRSHGGFSVFSKGFQHLAKHGQQAIGHLLDDPELLDARRPVAVLTYMLQQQPLTPTAEEIWELAQEQVPAGQPVDAEGLIVARQRLVNDTAKIADMLGKQQHAAHRQAARGELLTAYALPVFERFGQAITDLSLRYIPDEAARREFLKMVEARVRASIGEIQTSVVDSE